MSTTTRHVHCLPMTIDRAKADARRRAADAAPRPSGRPPGSPPHWLASAYLAASWRSWERRGGWRLTSGSITPGPAPDLFVGLTCRQACAVIVREWREGVNPLVESDPAGPAPPAMPRSWRQPRAGAPARDDPTRPAPVPDPAELARRCAVERARRWAESRGVALDSRPDDPPHRHRTRVRRVY